jgi:hypothetical protein
MLFGGGSNTWDPPLGSAPPSFRPASVFKVIEVNPRPTKNARPRFKVGEPVRLNNGVRNRGVVKSVRKRPDEGYDALIEISGEPLFRKAIFWVPESELEATEF